MARWAAGNGGSNAELSAGGDQRPAGRTGLLCLCVAATRKRVSRGQTPDIETCDKALARRANAGDRAKFDLPSLFLVPQKNLKKTIRSL